MPTKKFHSHLTRVPKRFLASLVLKARIFQGRHGGKGSPDRGTSQSKGSKVGDSMGNQVPVLLSGHISPNKIKGTFYIEPGTNLQHFPLQHLILCSWKGLFWNKEMKENGDDRFLSHLKNVFTYSFLICSQKTLGRCNQHLTEDRTQVRFQAGGHVGGYHENSCSLGLPWGAFPWDTEPSQLLTQKSEERCRCATSD